MQRPLLLLIAAALLSTAAAAFAFQAPHEPAPHTDRTAICQALEAKIKRGQPLVVHVFVPLCDNDNQGIVKVNASLGNGQNPKTNLYWGAGYGIKTHLRRSEGWRLLSEGDPAEAEILDRAVFERKFTNGTTLHVVADAYDGADMTDCISDFYASLAGSKSGKVQAGTTSIEAWQAADLMVLNGHNGLMDINVDVPARADARGRDAVIIACASKGYFLEPLAQLGAYPLINTTGLLAPEAYVLKAVVESWAQLKDGAEVRAAAGVAYNTYQKCGLKGATNLFHTGW